MNIIVSPYELRCPKCGAVEDHPTMKDAIVIRGYKVDNYSQCLRCSGYYNAALELTPDNHDPKKGWFR